MNFIHIQNQPLLQCLTPLLFPQSTSITIHSIFSDFLSRSENSPHDKLINCSNIQGKYICHHHLNKDICAHTQPYINILLLLFLRIKISCSTKSSAFISLYDSIPFCTFCPVWFLTKTCTGSYFYPKSFVKQKIGNKQTFHILMAI